MNVLAVRKDMESNGCSPVWKVSGRIDGSLSVQFRNMSFLCACLIILLHSSVFPAIGTLQWWIVYLIGRNGICLIAVPFFFLAAGFFLAGRFDEPDWWRSAVISRVPSLLFPFVIWRVIGVIFHIIIAVGINLVGYEGYQGTISIPDFSVMWFLNLVGVNPFVCIGVLWFVRALFLLVLLSGFLVKMLSSCCSMTLLLLFGVYCGVEVFRMPGAWDVCFSYFLPLSGLFYFCSGIVLRRKRFYLTAPWCFILCGVGIVLLVCKGMLALDGFSCGARFLGVVMVPFLMLGVWNLVGWISGKWNRFAWSAYAFPIYLMHMHFILIITMIVSLIGCSRAGKTDLSFMLLKFSSALVGSIVITIVLKRRFPRFACRAFGGR